VRRGNGAASARPNGALSRTSTLWRISRLRFARNFQGATPDRAQRIARHAGARSSGRIGRTSAGRALDPEAVQLAVVAAVRHEDTRYDDLLMNGVPRADAREFVREDIDRVVRSWLGRGMATSVD
jgi:hypothetical protein